MAQLAGFSNNTLIANYQKTGAYRAEVVDARGCVGSTGILNMEDSASNKLFIFPNPAKTLVEFAFHNPGRQSVNWQITVFNAAGFKVLQDAVFNAGPYPRMIQNVSRWAKGIYLVQLSDASGRILGRGKLLVH